MLRIKEHSVVLLNGIIVILGHFGRDSNYPPRNGGDFQTIWQVNSNLGDLLVLVLTDENALADGLNCFQTGIS